MAFTYCRCSCNIYIYILQTYGLILYNTWGESEDVPEHRNCLNKIMGNLSFYQISTFISYITWEYEEVIENALEKKGKERKINRKEENY